MKKKNLIVAVACILALLLVIGIGHGRYIKSHTFTLSDDNIVKSEQIQAINGKVTIYGTTDTSITFTDIENGKTYTIGYITSGMAGTIQLEKGKWYRVEGSGELTIRPVNVRIE